MANISNENIPEVYKSIQPVDYNLTGYGGEVLYCNGLGNLDEFSSNLPDDIFKALNKSTGIPGSNIFSQLNYIFKSIEGGPWYIDSLQGNIFIHNKNFEDQPRQVYTYKQENGEVISATFNLQPKYNGSTDGQALNKASGFNPDNPYDPQKIIKSIQEDIKGSRPGKFNTKGIILHKYIQTYHADASQNAALSAKWNSEENIKAIGRGKKVTKENVDDTWLPSSSYVDPWETTRKTVTRADNLENNLPVEFLTDAQIDKVATATRNYVGVRRYQDILLDWTNWVKENTSASESELEAKWMSYFPKVPVKVSNNGRNQSIGKGYTLNYTKRVSFKEAGVKYNKSTGRYDYSRVNPYDFVPVELGENVSWNYSIIPPKYGVDDGYIEFTYNTKEGSDYARVSGAQATYLAFQRSPVGASLSMALAASRKADYALALGKYLLNESRKRTEMELTCTLVVVGRPSLTNYMSIELWNVGKKYSGKWYVKTCTHSFTCDRGYLTTLGLVKRGD